MSDDDIAQRLASLRHYLCKFTLVGTGLNVQGSVRDGFILSRATENDIGTAPPPPSECSANLQVVISGVTICTCVGPVFGDKYYTWPLDINGTYTIPIDDPTSTPPDCTWTYNSDDVVNPDVHLASDCSDSASPGPGGRIEIAVYQNGDDSYSIDVFDRGNTFLFMHAEGALGDTLSNMISCNGTLFGMIGSGVGGSVVITAT